MPALGVLAVTCLLFSHSWYTSSRVCAIHFNVSTKQNSLGLTQKPYKAPATAQ
jgi:hypothetical protein